MPVEQLGPHRFRWGKHGKAYATREQAAAQGRAAYASGYREDSPAARAAMHRALSASKRAESRYVLDVHAIMRRTHASILQHVGVPDHLRLDAAGDDAFLRRLFVLQRPDVERAFDAMAKDVNASSAKGSALVGIRPADVAGLAAVVAKARENNVRLIQSASKDFLDQVRAVLEQYGGLHPGKGAGPKRLAQLLKAPAPDEEPEEPRDLTEALQARVGVSRSRANLIARTETLKLNSQVAQHRQRSAGITQYKWSTSHDERVRPTHRALDGQVFSWDDPPVTNDAGDRNHPGEDYQCRCVPIPQLGVLAAPAAAAPSAESGSPSFEQAAE